MFTFNTCDNKYSEIGNCRPLFHLGLRGKYCIQGTFDCQLFKFSLGSFGAFPIFDDLVSRKRLVVEQNGPKFGPLV